MEDLDWYNEEHIMCRLEEDDEEYDAVDLMVMLGTVREEMTL